MGVTPFVNGIGLHCSATEVETVTEVEAVSEDVHAAVSKRAALAAPASVTFLLTCIGPPT